jgi:AAT family amino acid transporter
MAATDPEKVAYTHDGSPASVDRTHEHIVNEDRLRRSLSARQVQMIAIGGVSNVPVRTAYETLLTSYLNV